MPLFKPDRILGHEHPCRVQWERCAMVGNPLCILEFIMLYVAESS